MHKLRVYIDTSVIGGCLDPEFALDSNALFEKFIKGEYVAVLSQTVFDEIRRAPEEVRALVKKLPEDSVEEVEVTQEALMLAETYIRLGVIPDHSYTDAVHIAVATVHHVDVLVSWNFKHIVNLKRIHGYNSVNLREGFRSLEICSPREVIYDED